MTGSRERADETARMPVALRVGIVLVTIGWILTGVFLQVQSAPFSDEELGLFVSGWVVAALLQAGLLLSPLAYRRGGVLRGVVLFAMLPGLLLTIFLAASSALGVVLIATRLLALVPGRILGALPVIATCGVWVWAFLALWRSRRRDQERPVPAGRSTATDEDPYGYGLRLDDDQSSSSPPR